jgi:hypothetical protein
MPPIPVVPYPVQSVPVLYGVLPDADDQIVVLVDAAGGAMAMLPLLTVVVLYAASTSGGSSILTRPVSWLVLCGILWKIVGQMSHPEISNFRM